jgi:vancomycin resistance protein YoaR
VKLVSSVNRVRKPSNQPPRNAAQSRGTPSGRTPATPGVPATAKGAPANQTTQKSNTGKPVKKARSRTKKLIIGIVASLLVVVLLSGGLFVAFCYYVESLDTVFPNVWADGINVSGLTLEETIERLIDEGYEDNVEGVATTVIFPDQSSFSFTGNEVGLSLDAAEAAATVFAFGRNGDFFGDAIIYIQSLLERTDLVGLSTPALDDTIVRTLAAEYTYNFNVTLFDSNLDIVPDESITIVKGTGLHNADEDEVFYFAIQTLFKAVEEHTHLRAYYTPEKIIEDGVDLILLFETIHIDPVSSILDMETLQATESSEGRTFDLDEAKDKLANATIGMPVVIPIFAVPPDITQDEMQDKLFRDVLSESITSLTNDANRIRNVTLATEAINGTILNPGDTFSFNQVVGMRTTEKGYMEANVIRNGIFVPSTGGGICQVTSTLHDAVMHTPLKVVERRAHGLRISYMPLAVDGMITIASGVGTADERREWLTDVGRRRFANDATVSWGTMDYKFQNNTDFPVKIEASVRNRTLTVRLHGTNLDGSYFVTETIILSSTDFVEVERQDPDLPVGTRVRMQGAAGQRGYRAEVFKRHYSADGELLSRERVGISNYNSQNRIYLVGTREPDPIPEPDPTPEPTPEVTPEPTPEVTPDPELNNTDD